MILAAKILLSPLCVVAVSWAGRRWGMAVAGVLGGLPMVAGPILLVETLVHGRDFGSTAATGTLLGLVSLSAFVVVYGRVAAGSLFGRPQGDGEPAGSDPAGGRGGDGPTRSDPAGARGGAGPIPSLLAGWAAFLVGVAIFDPVHPPRVVSLLLACAAFVLGLRLLPPARTTVPMSSTPPAWDLPARALAALCLVVALTGISGTLGPHLSGLLAPFPIITSVLAVFTHAHGGRAQLEVLLRNFLFGFYGFAAFCFVLATALPGMSTGAAFGLATGAALLVQVAVFVARRRARPAVAVR